MAESDVGQIDADGFALLENPQGVDGGGVEAEGIDGLVVDEWVYQRNNFRFGAALHQQALGVQAPKKVVGFERFDELRGGGFGEVEGFTGFRAGVDESIDSAVDFVAQGGFVGAAFA